MSRGGGQSCPAGIRSTYVGTKGLLADSVLSQRSFILKDKVSACGIDEKTGVLCANTTVARADGGDRWSFHGESGSATMTGALVDSRFLFGCHDLRW